MGGEEERVVLKRHTLSFPQGMMLKKHTNAEHHKHHTGQRAGKYACTALYVFSYHHHHFSPEIHPKTEKREVGEEREGE